ncbi:Ig-like domain-containing protein [Spirosoma sp. RP8]|uniref:Ig-like domain-containing protein n=1 Tax=Spirosoma liriopis TaxID=2937440 RepID=A0ABT0HT11_9BACT|nr:cellulose binding domain-containing protein [Spirosoma liriopis]MCK8494768.1 Ig-like domain-containing protein [Spirosoma liriopis]
MKNLLLLLGSLLTVYSVQAQTVTLVQESFETDGRNTRYTSNEFDSRSASSSLPYFTRALTNPLLNPFNPSNVCFGTNKYPVTIGGVDGAVFWSSEAVRSTATSPADDDRAPGVVTLNAINASNYGSLKLVVAFADARGPSSPTLSRNGGELNPQYDSNDFIRLQYSTNGGTTYNTLAQFVGNNPSGQGFMQLDADLDGTADGAQTATNTLDINMRDFSFNIPGSPSSLLVRVQVDQRGGSEELAFDNIRVTGVANTVSPPTLSNLENDPLPYAEGQGATKVTNTITVVNPGGSTLSRATVSISSGRGAGDQLVFTNTNLISGSYNSSTGVLELNGTAPTEDYQAALRSVAFRNSDAINVPAGTRTLDFVVYNGTTSSNQVSRNVTVTASLDAATTLPYQEDFEVDKEGTRYSSNTFVARNGTGAAWLRTTANPYQTNPPSPNPTTFSNISGSAYWYGNNTNSLANSATRMGTLQTLQINTAGYTNLTFSIRIGASSGANARWQNTDYFKVYYRVAGGAQVPILSFRGNTATQSAQGNLQQDADPSATTGIPTGSTLTPNLNTFTVSLPASAYGQVIDFLLVQQSDDISAELAFDNIQLTGTQLAAPTVTTNSSVSNVTTTSASLGGNITTDGGASVTERGIVYKAGASVPTASDSKVTSGNGIGTFSATLAGLTSGTQYTARAYAINSVGTGFGSTVTFVTTPGSPQLNTPTNGTYVATGTPIYTGTTQVGSTVQVYVDGTLLNATPTVDNAGNFTVVQPSSLNEGNHTVYATATVTINGTTSPTSANSNTNTFIIDVTAPTVSLTSATAPNGSSYNSSPFVYNATFSENVANFVASDITVGNGSVTGFSAISSSQYSFTVTPTTSGAVSVSLARSVASDVAGNGNVESDPYTITYAPLPTISGFTATTPSVCVGSPVTFTATIGNVTGAYTYTLTNSVSTTTGTSSNPAFNQSVVSTNSGTQNFTLTVSANNGQVTTAFASVTVKSTLTNIRGSQSATSLCAPGGQVNFQVTPDPIESYTVTIFRNNVQDGQTTGSYGSTIIFPRNVTQSANYQIVVTSSCASLTTTFTPVTVTPLPTPSIVGLATAYCQDAGSQPLKGEPSGGVFTIDGNPATNFDPTSLTIGQHTVVYSYTNAGGCSNTATQIVTVNETPTAPRLVTQTGGPYPAGVSSLTISQNTGDVILTVSGCTNGTINWSGGNAATLAVSTANTGTQSFTATCTQNGCTSPAATATVTVVLPTLRVLSRDPDNGQQNSNTIKPYLLLQNVGTMPISYSSITVRYWLTTEPNMNLIFQKNYVAIGQNNLNLRYVPLASPRQGATGYIEYSFNSAAGSLAPMGDSGPLEVQAYQQNYAVLNQLDDYSYINNSTFTLNPRITAYQNGVIFYGTEPAGSGNTRVAAKEAESILRVNVLGNPVIGHSAEVEISGVSGQSVLIRLVDSQGKPVFEHSIKEVDSTERVSLPLGTAQGILLLNVSTANQRQQIKLLRP